MGLSITKIDTLAERLASLSGCLVMLGYLGSGVVFVGFIFSKIMDLSKHIASGSDGILISLGVITWMTIWSWRDLKKIMKGYTSKYQNYILALSVIIGLLACTYLLVMQTIFYNSDGDLQTWVGSRCYTIWPLKPNGSTFIKVVETIFNSFFAAGTIISLAIVLFLMGKFTAGLSAGIALHNYFNGANLDFSAFFEMILETSVPDTLGAILAFLFFVWSLVISRGANFD